MNLRKEVLYRFLITLIVPLVIMSLLSVIFFNSAFDRYKQLEKNEKFERIENLLKQYYSNDLSKQDFQNFFWYIQNEKINIVLYDRNGNVLYEYDKSDPNAIYQKNYIEKDPTKIYDRNGNFAGFVSFGYDQTNYQDKQTDQFIRQMTFLLLVSIIISVGVASMVSAIFSKNLSKPIVKLSEQTRALKNGNYNTKFDIESNITEINTLIKDIRYLGNNLKLQEEIRTNYAQDISHELRTPIANLQLYIEAIGDKMIEPDEETIATLMHEISRLSSLVDDLKSSFMQDIDKNTLEFTRLNLNDELKTISTSFAQRMKYKNIRFKLIEKNKVSIVTDKNKLKTIINNLLTNAIKACLDHDGSIQLTLLTQYNKILISVKDNGVGISPENQARIFDRFYRVDDARNTQKNGYGLGLSIVKTSAELIHAKILLNSKENFGAEFIVEFDNNDVDAKIYH